MAHPDSSTLLTNALVVDGTGAEPRREDVLVVGNRIAQVGGDIDALDAAQVIDLSDLVLSPGFIDSHTHYDAQILWDPDLRPTSAFGITSVLMGNCGYSVAPAHEQDRELIILTLEAVEGMSRRSLAEGIDWSFETFSEYILTLRERGTRLNVGAMVGHSTLRSYVMGKDSIERAATAEEVARMAEVLRLSLEAGAIGFSSSRSEVDNGAYGKPVGSRMADYSELLTLARVLRNYGSGIIQLLPCSMREGPHAMAKVVSDVSREGGRPVLCSSVLTGMFGPPGAARDALNIFAALDGENYPLVACMPMTQQVTLRDPFILALYSKGFIEALEHEPSARGALYADPSWRVRARQGLTAMGQRFSEIAVSESARHREAEGRSLGELAQRQGITPLDVMIDLSLEEDLGTRFVVPLHNSDETELKSLLLDSRCLVSLSDAGAHQSQICDAIFGLHLLQHWVRELEALPLEFAVWRLTGQQAQAMQLRGRGQIAPGMAADLVAFDMDTVGYGPLERVHDLPGSADRLVAESFGIEHVWVNGCPIREHGRNIPGSHPGEILTSSALSS
jgi:N-acyl-D-amino-acid deacylase